MTKKTIGIFFGGTSPEHDISVLTGVQVFHAVQKDLFTAVPIFVSQSGEYYTGNALTDTKNYKDVDTLLSGCKKITLEKTQDGVYAVSKKLFGSTKTKLDVAFNAFHGAYGEGGAFQGYCEVLGLPCTSSDVLGASLCMDKIAMKRILVAEEVASVPFVVAYEHEFKKDSQKTITSIEALGYPVFVKPSNGGSSIGVTRATTQPELKNALEVAFAFDAQALVEKEFEGKDAEINISFMGLWNGDVEHSVAEEVYSDTDFLDFENKYLKGGKSKKAGGSKGMASTNRKIPAEISDELLKKLVADGEKAFRKLHCSGVVRIDFLVNKKTGNYALVEVNTIPGSLAFYLWEKSGLPFDQLITSMVEIAFLKSEDQKKHTKTFNSSVFKNL